MSLCCIGGVCVPYTALWPLVVFAVKFLWEKFGYLVRRLLGFRADPAGTALPPKDGACACAPVDVPAATSAADFAARVAATAAGRPLIVDFSATWCRPCKKIAPVFDALAAEHAAVADFLKVDIDELDDVATAENVMVVPTFHVYVDKLAAAQLTGSDEGKLRALVAKHVAAKKVA
eukprot:CAMPEP_0185703862 /NCGR_PEP_ID=MMETSP1164-20130828/15607_1 /TAXON_ID=1104430 /ORGANISM="Chrysoreinhardia sp, Strain CCMP2950" /LENGTH=175 /DNA_ID=CAMNT_0028371179 /DNA_START=1 /DNA_END=531 /DNA_ORIENTATION=+